MTGEVPPRPRGHGRTRHVVVMGVSGCGKSSVAEGISAAMGLPFAEADMTPMARSFYSDNKRVSNKAICEGLGIDLLYPSYREGLAAIGKVPA